MTTNDLRRLDRFLEECVLLWRLSDLLAALIYATAAFTLVTVSTFSAAQALVAAYPGAVLALWALERSSAWNPAVIDLRSRAYREEGA